MTIMNASCTSVSWKSNGPAWLLSLALSVAVLLAPALWNGFALVFFDTGAYVERVFKMTLSPGRSFFYGIFLWVTSLGWFSFWGPVLVQSLMTLWVIQLMLRCHKVPAGPITTAVFCLGLGVSTGISWYTSQLMPDTLMPLVVLTLWLLGFCWHELRWHERMGLAALTLLGLMSHMSGMALGVGLALVILLGKVIVRGRGWSLTVFSLPPVAAVAASLLLMPILHYSFLGKASFTPGGPVFIFGRLVQDGIAQRWLAEHCPTPGVRLCAVQNHIPRTADEFLWTGGSAFQEIGGWSGSGDAELEYLVRESIKAYPWLFVWTSLRATAEQMTKVATGDGLDEFHGPTRWYFTDLLPRTAKPFQEARQQQDQVTQQLFDTLNTVHVPVAYLSVLALLVVAGRGVRARRHDLAGLALFVLVALVGNAFICGALSNPHDRYQSRMVWLATLVVGMAAISEGFCMRLKNAPKKVHQ